MHVLKKNPALFLGLAISVIFLLLFAFSNSLLDALDIKFYDLCMNLKNPGSHPDVIVIVDIGDDSVERLGRWPWQRSVIARAIEIIQKSGPRYIGLNIILSEPEEAQGLKQIKKLTELIGSDATQQTQKILRALQHAQEELDNDQKLESAIKQANNVILPVVLKTTRYSENKIETDFLLPQAIPNIQNPESAAEMAPADTAVAPLPDFLAASKGIGHVNQKNDLDGVIRSDPVIQRFGNIYLPSFPLKLATAYLDIPNNQIQATLGMSVDLGGKIGLPLKPDSTLLVSFKGSQNAFKSCPFYDVYHNKIPPDLFKDKIVLISPSASGVYNPISTPMGGLMSVGEFTANVVWTILNQQFIHQFSFERKLIFALIIVTGILISLVFPRLNALFSGLTFVGVLSVMIGGPLYLFVSKSIWIRPVYPFLELVLGYIGVVTINYFVTETGKQKIEGESADTNRMLGLSFQNQGMLDMAFDKFRKVPVTDETKDLLYNLALDYERKRQYNKAASVYEYIEQHDPNYRDIAPKKKKLLQASETMIYGDGFLSGGLDDGMLTVDTGTKPTLGRYEIIKQLGKGAMGIVYLGQDPRINRTTAIKTFRFSDDFEPEEAEKLKERFFREAESAGTLSHPNIVTIYDAGDEGDLAYIAMEYLEGENFQKYTKKRHLLPMRKVIDYVADIAEGLDYAHEKGIVHRDIKPANIMFLKNGQVKITDFGIARITATSQTQTGVVKGTPHYMSPEQISGKKVDGRSDIFSLGAMLFQLLTGELPFRGDSPASLMHRIMHVPHPNPRDINPRIVKPLVAITDKALEKDRNKRYQKAGHMAQHLRALGAKIDEITASKQVE